MIIKLRSGSGTSKFCSVSVIIFYFLLHPKLILSGFKQIIVSKSIRFGYQKIPGIIFCCRRNLEDPKCEFSVALIKMCLPINFCFYFTVSTKLSSYAQH